MDSSNPEQFIQYREQLLTRLREVIPVLSQQMFSARNKRGEQRAVLKPEAARILKNVSRSTAVLWNNSRNECVSAALCWLIAAAVCGVAGGWTVLH